MLARQGQNVLAHVDKKSSPNSSSYIVTMAASAGGLKALSTVVSALPVDFSAPILVVQHMSRRHPSHLADILNRRTAIRVKAVVEGEVARPAIVYIAQPDNHLLVSSDGTLSLNHQDLVHFVRPSADLLFSSAAKGYGNRAIAVVLSGTGVDGANGSIAVRKAGGTVIAQDLNTAEYAGMPDAVIKTGSANFVLPLTEIAAKLVQLVAAGETRDAG